MKTAVRDQVDALGINQYFDYFAKLMKANPPAPEDAPTLAKMAAIGLAPEKDFDASKLGFFDKEAIRSVPKLAQAKIMEYFKKMGQPSTAGCLPPKPEPTAPITCSEP
jgi:hypothetical protein